VVIVISTRDVETVVADPDFLRKDFLNVCGSAITLERCVLAHGW
jgi:hypothetical protein